MSKVSHQGGLLSEKSLIRVVFYQKCLSSGRSFIRNVSHQGGLLSKRSLIRVVIHHKGLSPGWSLITGFTGALNLVLKLKLTEEDVHSKQEMESRVELKQTEKLYFLPVVQLTISVA